MAAISIANKNKQTHFEYNKLCNNLAKRFYAAPKLALSFTNFYWLIQNLSKKLFFCKNFKGFHKPSKF